MLNRIMLVGVMFMASCDLAASPFPDYPFIHARGSAAQYVVPDRGAVDFEILARGADPELARSVIEERIAQLRALAQSVGLPADNLEIREVRRDMPKNREGTPDAGLYELRCGVRIKVDDLSQWPALALPLMSMANLDSFSTAFSASEREQIESDLIKQAIVVARRRGEAMAAGFGRKLGPVAGVTAGALHSLGGALALATTQNGVKPNILQLQGRESLATIGVISFSHSVDVVFRIK